jgi:hypothetical protein
MDKLLTFAKVIHELNETGYGELAVKVVEAVATEQIEDLSGNVFNVLCRIGHHTLANEFQSLLD